MKRILCVLALVCLPAFGQADIFTISHSATLSAAGTALSVQLPADGSHQTKILEATVASTAACAFRLETNGAAATAINATAATIVAVNPETTPAALRATPNITAWTGSGIPAGTAISPTWSIPAGAILPFGGGRILSGSGADKNYILRIVSPCTATVTLYLSVEVRR